MADAIQKDCPKCGGVNFGAAPTCILCGAPFSATKIGTCKKCAATFELDPDIRFCLKCGDKLPRNCACGKLLPQAATFCPYCGIKV